MSADEEPRISPRLAKIFKLATVLISLLLALIFGEVLARGLTTEVYLQTRLHDGGLLIPFKPNQDADLIMDEFRCRYNINGLGYRDRRGRSIKKAKGKKRLLLLGDSFSAGWGVQYEEIYSTLLERELQAEIVNAAKNGGCMLWYIHQARYAYPLIQADAVIVQVFDNDLVDCDRNKRDLNIQEGEAVGELPKDIDPRQFGLMKYGSRFFNSLLLRRKLRNLKRKLTGKAVHKQPYVTVGSSANHKILSRQEAYEKYKEQIIRPPEWMLDFQFHDPKLLSQWQVRIAEHDSYLRQLIDECNKEKRAVFILYIPSYQVFLQGKHGEDLLAANPFSKSLKKLCKEKKTAFLDATIAFEKEQHPEQLYYVFDGHLNALGHKVLGAALKQPLREFLAR
jgi:lysophospholipase L1-like esterase